MAKPDGERLHEVATLCAAALRAARTALGDVTEVLVGRAEADRMKTSDAALHELRDMVEMLTPARPVSPGAREVVATAHVEGDMRRVGELTQQIGEIAWSRRTRTTAMPPGVHTALTAVSGTTLTLLGQAVEVAELTAGGRPEAAASAVEAAGDLRHRLPEVTAGQRALDDVLVREAAQVDATDAVDVALLGRCYESCAWHAVAAVRHLAALAR